VVGTRPATEQVIGEMDVVGAVRGAAADQPVEVVVGQRDALTVAPGERREVAVVVVGVLLAVAGRGDAGGGFVRVAGLDQPVVTVVRGGGQVALGVGSGGWPAVGGGGEGGVGLRQRGADRPLDALRVK